MIPPDDDGIVVVMSETEPRTVTREEFNRELVQALDDLVADAQHHGELIATSFARSDELSRRLRDEATARAQTRARPLVARETPPSYGDTPERLDHVEQRLDRVEQRLDRVEQRLDRVEQRLDRVEQRLDRVEQRLDRVDERLDRIEQRLDRIEQTLTEIRERMATKVELEATNENVKKMADGYVTIGKRLDAVAEMLKLRVVMP